MGGRLPLSFGIMQQMKTIRHIIVGVAIAVCLAVLLFPPLRSPSPAYAEPKLVGPPVGGRFVAMRIPRVTGLYGPSLSRLSDAAVVRTEVDGGELLRELALIVVLFGAAYLWMPALVDRARLQSAQSKSEISKP